jgi:hypothetical protein
MPNIADTITGRASFKPVIAAFLSNLNRTSLYSNNKKRERG